MRGNAWSPFLLAAALSLLVMSCTERGDVLSPGPGGEGVGAAGAAGGGGTGGADVGGGTTAPLRADTLSAGSAHTCAIVDQRLYCWGNAEDGALGTGQTVDSPLPSQVGEDDDWSEVVTGSAHTCALRTGGSVWCWGTGDRGQIGSGEFAGADTPTFVSTAAPVEHLASRFFHVLTVQSGGALWGWGEGTEGQLAQGESFQGDGISHSEPVLISDDTWSFADAGDGHSCAIKMDGSLWCTGRNATGEAGLGDGSAGQVRELLRVGDANDWSTVRAGQNHTCGLREPSAQGFRLYCWGGNDFGQLGTGDVIARFSPEPVGDDADWTGVTLDTFHTCGIRGEGELYCWGRNYEGQLGTGDFNDTTTPARVGEGTSWELVNAGRFHTCAKMSDGTVWCAGQNDAGQLGTGDFESRPAMSPVALSGTGN